MPFDQDGELGLPPGDAARDRAAEDTGSAQSSGEDMGGVEPSGVLSPDE